MKRKVTSAGLVLVTLLVAWWAWTKDEAPPAVAPTPSAPTAVASTQADEVTPSSDELDPPAEVLDAGAARCAPSRPHDGVDSLVLELAGPGLPPTPSNLVLDLAWQGPVRSQRFLVRLVSWRVELWPCGPTTARIAKGPFRLGSTPLPSSGHVRLELQPAPPTLTVTLAAKNRVGLPVEGAVIRLDGCERVSTGRGGLTSTRCDVASSPRLVSADRPFRLAVEFVPADATHLELTVLGREEVEPGKIGLGFVNGVEPVVGSLAKDGPAERAGVRRGDVLIEVDGYGVANVQEATPRIIGPPGVPVRLKLRRGADVLLVDVSREP